MAAVLVGGCGGSGGSGRAAGDASTAKLPADYRPIPAGRGPLYRLPAVSGAVARRAEVGGLSCGRRRARSYGVHLELYGRGLVVPIPAGIGIAPPQVRDGAYVRGGACVYPLRTYEPTGVVVVDAVSRTPPALGTLFDVWGQPLSSSRLAEFDGPVTAFVGGRRWRGPVRAIPLLRHAEIVLESGAHVAPHPAYQFPPGL